MALIDNLVSYWKLDETSGNAADPQGSNTLTNNNTVTYVPAVINNGADMELSSSQSLSITDGSQSGLDITGDLSVSMWIKPESITGDDALLTKFDSTGNQRSYAFTYFSTNFLAFLTSSNGTNAVQKSVAQTWVIGTTYYVSVVYDASAGSAEFYVDGSKIGSTQTGYHTSLHNGTAPFHLGALNVTATSFFDGVMDEVGIWDRTLSAAEISELYNGGAGLAYPFTGDAFTPRVTIF